MNTNPEVTEIEAIDAEAAESKTQRHSYIPLVATGPVAFGVLVECARSQAQGVFRGERAVDAV